MRLGMRQGMSSFPRRHGNPGFEEKATTFTHHHRRHTERREHGFQTLLDSSDFKMGRHWGKHPDGKELI